MISLIPLALALKSILSQMSTDDYIARLPLSFFSPISFVCFVLTMLFIVSSNNIFIHKLHIIIIIIMANEISLNMPFGVVILASFDFEQNMSLNGKYEGNLHSIV